MLWWSFRRTSIRLVGSAGQSLHDAWAAEGPSTLFGIHVRDFPNMFYMGPVQAGATFNYTHTVCEAAEHISAMVRHCIDHDPGGRAHQGGSGVLGPAE